jgi:hypothetical protein
VKIVDGSTVPDCQGDPGYPGADLDAIKALNYTGMAPSAVFAGYSPIDLEVTTPGGLTVNKTSSDDPSLLYVESDVDGDGYLEDMVIVYYGMPGEYDVSVSFDGSDGSGETTYDLMVYEWGNETVLADDTPISEIPPDPYTYTATSCCTVDGDADNSGKFNISDAVFIVNRVFKGGPTPPCCDGADADSNGQFNISDAVYIINRVFKGGPAPVCGSAGNGPCP